MTGTGKIEFTAHSATMLRERRIERSWVERVLTAPDWQEPDPTDPAAARAFGAIAEARGKILRVVYTPIEGGVRVVTAFFDGRARKPSRSDQ
ncbi:MAG: DUF4258 domain-containing protein [Alphaproteobacteria bacterium]|nr:DUF4258 domain-containing protein [Alphaproteobacteria bacterium]MBU6473246.1 DUF4258 domain-containing protein [Alphaproteobacteria bacterium]MDE2011428.1 DUF4258 domain-containing protein [Alphaproteobacteria bacterium]MDE2071819.1 DUF4258 domain-containing protein [Alphaproteobacteria bacterium]MDE2350920.1 DUF4258 domain-containing protein [Alphaproteobacteria bacterium]